MYPNWIDINMGPIRINIALGHLAWDMGPWAQGVLGLYINLDWAHIRINPVWAHMFYIIPLTAVNKH